MKAKISTSGLIKIPQELRIKHNFWDNAELELVSTEAGLLLVDPLEAALKLGGAVRVITCDETKNIEPQTLDEIFEAAAHKKSYQTHEGPKL